MDAMISHTPEALAMLDHLQPLVFGDPSTHSHVARIDE